MISKALPIGAIRIFNYLICVILPLLKVLPMFLELMES